MRWVFLCILLRRETNKTQGEVKQKLVLLDMIQQGRDLNSKVKTVQLHIVLHALGDQLAVQVVNALQVDNLLLSSAG